MAKIVDKNLEVPGKIDRQDIIWYNALEKPFSVHGAHHNFDRLPENFPILSGFRDNSTGEYKESCTSDGCHPNDLGFYKMALGIGKVVKKVLGEY